MTRFQISLIATLLASGLWISQLATSFPLIRWGCVLILIGYFIAIAIDAFLDKANVGGEGFYGDWITIVTPHIGYAVGLLFLVLVGIYVGW
jgi:hypothetical protein